ncbi:hypothetical protein F5880DRAFT_1458667, partial [Lentinula raphanica]
VVHPQRPHRAVTARWAAESARPFRIVEDRCFRWLQKEGRPNQYVPSKATVAQDVKRLYSATKEQLAKELQVSDTISIEGRRKFTCVYRHTSIC